MVLPSLVKVSPAAVAAVKVEEDSAYNQGYTFEVTQTSNGGLTRALDAAFNYRGNITVTSKDGSESEGYLSHVDAESIEVWASDDSRKTLPVVSIQRLVFSGRDPAEGKSWEAWVKKQEARKAAEPEPAMAS